jgi:hypothetical protein
MLHINGKPRDDGPPEQFPAEADPIHGGALEPEQL